MITRKFLSPAAATTFFAPAPRPGASVVCFLGKFLKTSPLEWLKLHFRLSRDLKIQCVYLILRHLQEWFKYVFGFLSFEKKSDVKFKNAWHFDVMRDSETLCSFAWESRKMRDSLQVCTSPGTLLTLSILPIRSSCFENTTLKENSCRLDGTRTNHRNEVPTQKRSSNPEQRT